MRGEFSKCVEKGGRAQVSCARRLAGGSDSEREGMLGSYVVGG